MITSDVDSTARLRWRSAVGVEIGVTDWFFETHPPAASVDHVHEARVRVRQTTGRVVKTEQHQRRI